jgi:hypothetical protein
MTRSESGKPKIQALSRRFVKVLRQQFPWISADPSGFRAFVLGTMRAMLPRDRAGRKSNPTVEAANRLYEAQLKNGPADWHAIAATVLSNYASLPVSTQLCERRKLRDQVHSYRHQRKQRQNVSQIKQRFTTHVL